MRRFSHTPPSKADSGDGHAASVAPHESIPHKPAVTLTLANEIITALSVGKEARQKQQSGRTTQEIGAELKKQFDAHMALFDATCPDKVKVSFEGKSLIALDPSGKHWLVRPELMGMRSGAATQLIYYMARCCAFCAALDPNAPLSERIFATYLYVYSHHLGSGSYGEAQTVGLAQAFRELRTAGWSTPHEESALQRAVGRRSEIGTEAAGKKPRAEERSRWARELLTTAVIPWSSVASVAARLNITPEVLVTILGDPTNLRKQELHFTLRTQLAVEAFPRSAGMALLKGENGLKLWLSQAEDAMQRHSELLKLLAAEFLDLANVCKEKEKLEFRKSRFQCFITAAYRPKHDAVGSSNQQSDPLYFRGLLHAPGIGRPPLRAAALAIGSRLHYFAETGVTDAARELLIPLDRNGLLARANECRLAAANAETRLQQIRAMQTSFQKAIVPSWLGLRAQVGSPIELRIRPGPPIALVRELARLQQVTGTPPREVRHLLRQFPEIIDILRQQAPNFDASLKNLVGLLKADGLALFAGVHRSTSQRSLPFISLARLSRASAIPMADFLDAFINPNLTSSHANLNEYASKHESGNISLGGSNASLSMLVAVALTRLKTHRQRLELLGAVVDNTLNGINPRGRTKLNLGLFIQHDQHSDLPGTTATRWYNERDLRHRILTNPACVSENGVALGEVRGVPHPDLTAQKTIHSLSDHPLSERRFPSKKDDMPVAKGWVYSFAGAGQTTYQKWSEGIKQLCGVATRKIAALQACLGNEKGLLCLDLSADAVITYLQDEEQEHRHRLTTLSASARPKTTLHSALIAHREIRAVLQWMGSEKHLDAVIGKSTLWERLDFFLAAARSPAFESLRKTSAALNRTVAEGSIIAKVLAQLVEVTYDAASGLADNQDPVVRVIGLPLIQGVLSSHGAAYGELVRENMRTPLRGFPEVDRLVGFAVEHEIASNPSPASLARCFESATALRVITAGLASKLAANARHVVSADQARLLDGTAIAEAESYVLHAACRYLCAHGNDDDLGFVTKTISTAIGSLRVEMPGGSFRFIMSVGAVLISRNLAQHQETLLRSTWLHLMQNEEAPLATMLHYLGQAMHGAEAVRITKALLPTPADIVKMLQRSGISSDIQGKLIGSIPPSDLQAALAMLPDRDPHSLKVSGRTFDKSGLSEAALAIGPGAQRHMIARLAYYEARKAGQRYLTLKNPSNPAITAPNYYMHLGVPRNATQEIIATSWDILQKIFHPDQFSEQPEKAREIAELIGAASLAHDKLSNPATRLTYDRDLSLKLGLWRSGPPHFLFGPWFGKLIADGHFSLKKIEAVAPTAQKTRVVLGSGGDV